MKFEIEHFLSCNEYNYDIVSYIRSCIYYNNTSKKFISLFKIKEYNIMNNQIHFNIEYIINELYKRNEYYRHLFLFEVIVDGKKYLGCELNSVKYLNELYDINKSSKYVNLNMNMFNWKSINNIIIENIIE